MMGGHLGYVAGRRGDVNGTNFRHRCRTLVGVWSTVHLITTYQGTLLTIRGIV